MSADLEIRWNNGPAAHETMTEIIRHVLDIAGEAVTVVAHSTAPVLQPGTRVSKRSLSPAAGGLRESVTHWPGVDGHGSYEAVGSRGPVAPVTWFFGGTGGRHARQMQERAFLVQAVQVAAMTPIPGLGG